MKLKSNGRLLFLIILISHLFITHSCRKELRTDSESIKEQLDLQPDDNQVIYSPEEGSTVKVNPPPFTWLPVKKNIEFPPDYVKYSGAEFQGKLWKPIKEDYNYTLQISKDKNFNSGIIDIKGIHISTHALNEPLEAGEWFWRYGVENGKTVFSKTRKFVVPDDARIWPFPKNMKQVIHSIPKGHPRLYIPVKELDSYKSRAANGDLEQTLTKIKNSIEKNMGEELPPEPEFSVNMDSWWEIYNTVIPPCDRMETFGLVYLLTGDKKYGEEARRRLLHFFSWNPDGSTADRGHNESNYRIVTQGTRAYDWAYDLLTPEEREIVEKSLRRRAEQLYHRLKYRPGSEYHVYNRGSHEERITGFLGEVAICFAGEWEEAEDWLKYVLTIHWNLYPAWAKEDGAWHQGPSYWTFYQYRALHFLTALERATGIDLMQKDFFRNTPYYILYTNPPYAKFSPFGDGAHNPPTAMRAENMYIYSSLLNDPYLRWYADYLNVGHPKNILGILLKDDGIESKPPKDLPQSRYFPGVGLVSLHTDFGDADNDIHFLFHSDSYGGVSHGHPDQNAFTLEAFGEALAIASGYYPAFGSDHHRLWSRQTKSSNTVTFDDGIGQEGVAAAKGKVVIFENHELYDYILGDATEAYMGKLNKFYRHVIHIRPGVFIILDEVEAPEPVTFEWWLHALSEMKTNQLEKSITLSEGNARLKMKFLLPEELNFNQFTGFPHPPVLINYTDTTMPQFSRQYEDQWHFTASTPQKVTNANFVSVLVPYKHNTEPVFDISKLTDTPNDFSFELKINERAYSIDIRPEISVKEITY